MRLLPLLLLLASLAAVPAAAAPADDVLAPDCGNLGYGGSVAPTGWSSGCVGASVNLRDLTWTGWGGAEATATGSIAYNDCEPSCADGFVALYPAALRLDRIRRCASSLGFRRFYTRATEVATFPPGNAHGLPAGPADPFAFTVACPRPGYLVGLGRRHARLGPFVDDGLYDAGRIESLFGRPASVGRASGYLCRKRWPRLGMTAEFVVVGTDEADPCDAGLFNRAVLTDRRWHTPDGVRPGGPARRAARHGERRCTRATCGVEGFGFALHRSECALGRYPAVIAETAHGRVRRLVVHKRWCE